MQQGIVAKKHDGEKKKDEFVRVKKHAVPECKVKFYLILTT
jgi:hypothetical protein